MFVRVRRPLCTTAALQETRHETGGWGGADGRSYRGVKDHFGMQEFCIQSDELCVSLSVPEISLK